jgi:flavin-dependent dehydrogenase
MDILIAGGGVAGAIAGERARLTIVAPTLRDAIVCAP